MSGQGMETLQTIVVLLIAAIVPVGLLLRMFPVDDRAYIRSYLRGYFGEDVDLSRIERLLDGASKEELAYAKKAMERYCSRVGVSQTLQGVEARIKRERRSDWERTRRR